MNRKSVFIRSYTNVHVHNYTKLTDTSTKLRTGSLNFQNIVYSTKVAFSPNAFTTNNSQSLKECLITFVTLTKLFDHDKALGQTSFL